MTTATNGKLPTARVGRTDLEVTRLAFGCVPLGNYPTRLTDQEAAGALKCAYDSGIRYFDVAPLYGHGLAEHRLGTALREKPRDSFVLSTKVGRLLVPEPVGRLHADKSAGIFEAPLPFSLYNDYTYDGIMRSVEDSIQRLAIPSIDILHIHNIDPANHAPDSLEAMFRQCMDDGYKALDKLRAEGTVKALGVGNNSLEMCLRFSRTGDFDCYMMAGHYNLLDHAAAREFMPECARKGSSILLGSPFASGLLAAAEPEKAKYMYNTPSPDILDRVRRLREICEAHGVDMVSAALQYPLRHTVIACVVPGMRTAEEVTGCVTAVSTSLPDAVFVDMASAGLIPA